MSEQLYELLSDGDGIPWIKRAEHFVMLKVASGGVLPGELEEYLALCKHAAEVHPASSDKGEVADAAKKGLLNAIRSTVSSDVAQVRKTERTRGARVGKEVGTVSGALAGLLAGRRHGVGGAALGAALGGVGGRGAGKVVGEEIDRAKIKKDYDKKGSMEKTTGFDDDDTAKLAAEKEKPDKRYPIAGATIGAATGATAKILSKAKKYRDASEMADMVASGLEKIRQSHPSGSPAAAALGDKITKIRQAVGKKPSALHEGAKGGAVGMVGGLLAGAGIDKVRRVLRERKMKKHAGIAMPPTGPGPDEMLSEKLHQQEMVPDQGAEQQVAQENALGEFLTAQQQANEAEFFRQMAEEAKSQAEMASAENQNLQQQVGMLQQQTQQAQMGAQQESMMAQQTAQQASQDAMMARNESMQAQQSAISLRAAVTNYRQALMDLLAQDPTQQVPPPVPPQGPMPPGPGAAPGAAPGAPPGAPPAEAGPPPGPEAGGPPAPAGGPPEMMAPPPMPGMPPAGGPPMGGPPAPPAEPKAPAAPKPKAPAKKE